MMRAVGCSGELPDERRHGRDHDATNPDRIKVLVADDEETVRQVIGVLVTSDPGMDLVGMAADAESAIELARTRTSTPC
jgi:hypothetical protein